MIKITEKTAIAEVGALVCDALKKQGIDAFLSGGAVVSIYTVPISTRVLISILCR